MKKSLPEKLTIEKIEVLLQNKNLDPTLKADLEKKKEILENQQTVKK